jgi:hypothetical protein
MWHLLHANKKYANVAQVLDIALCWQCRLIYEHMSIHLFGPSVCLFMDLVSTDVLFRIMHLNGLIWTG